MERKAISGIMLMLLLIGTLVSAVNIQRVKAVDLDKTDPPLPGTLTIGNTILNAHIQNLLGATGIGTYTIETGTAHPNPGENVFYGGASGAPWSSYNTIHVTDTLRDYVTTMDSPTPDPGYTLVNMDSLDPAVTTPDPRTIMISWLTPENLQIVQISEVLGTTESDARVRITMRITNNDVTAHQVGVRYEWDLMINGWDGAWLRPWTDATTPGTWLDTETEWTSPVFQFWETSNMPDSLFSVYGGLSQPPGATTPDRIVYAHWGSSYARAHNYTPTGIVIGSETPTIGGQYDSAVLYYWNPTTINPSETKTTTAFITTFLLEQVPPIGDQTEETISNPIQSADLNGDGDPDFSWNSGYDISFVGQTLHTEINIQLVGDDPGDALRQQWEQGIEGIWSNAHEIVDGLYTYPIEVAVNWVDADPHHVVTVISGRGRADMTHWYTDLGTPPDGWGNDHHDEVAAHEAGHMLGLYDEYESGALDPVTRFISPDDSLMKNLGPTRNWHYQQIMEWLETKSGRDLSLAPSPLPPYPFDDPVQLPQAFDTAVTDVTPSKTIIGQGHSAAVDVSVENQGSFTETVNATVYADQYLIATFIDITLASESSTILTFTWNTTGVDFGNYSISAYVTPVPGETDTADNLFIRDTVIQSEWNQTHGGPFDDFAYCLIPTNDGGYALAGSTASYGAGNQDFWLVKTDSSGNVLWNKTYGGTGWDEAYSIVQTNDGGYALAGYTDSYGAGFGDFWLVKTDSNGNMLWNRTYGGADDDWATSVVQTGDGGYALAGYTDSYGAGFGDFWLIKTDSAGNLLWNTTYGGMNDDYASSVVQASDDGYVLAGDTMSFGVGETDFWLVKTNSFGLVLWNKTYGGTGWDEAYSIVQTNDGGYALAGYTDSYGAGFGDFWLIKTDSAGNIQLNQTYGGADAEFANSIIQTSDGGYALVGATYSYVTWLGDFWLVKTDSNGNMLWNRTYGGADDDWATSVVQTGDGGYAIVGNTYSTTAGSYDTWLIKIAVSSEGTVLVTIPGDVNGDRIVNVFDIYTLSKPYGSMPTSPNWNPNADINSDLIINAQDLEIVNQNYGKVL